MYSDPIASISICSKLYPPSNSRKDPKQNIIFALNRKICSLPQQVDLLLLKDVIEYQNNVASNYEDENYYDYFYFLNLLGLDDVVDTLRKIVPTPNIRKKYSEYHKYYNRYLNSIKTFCSEKYFSHVILAKYLFGEVNRIIRENHRSYLCWGMPEVEISLREYLSDEEKYYDYLRFDIVLGYSQRKENKVLSQLTFIEVKHIIQNATNISDYITQIKNHAEKIYRNFKADSAEIFNKLVYGLFIIPLDFQINNVDEFIRNNDEEIRRIYQIIKNSLNAQNQNKFLLNLPLLITNYSKINNLLWRQMVKDMFKNLVTSSQ